MDSRQAARDLARHESLAAHRRLVIEEDAVAGVHAVRLAIVHRDPVGVQLCDAIGRTRIERRGLALRSLLHLAEHLRGRGLVEAGLRRQAEDAHRLEQSQRADGIGVRRVLGRLERHRDMALRAQVVDFVGQHLLHDANQVGGIGEIAVVQREPPVGVMRIFVQVIDAIGVERRGAALDAVDFVTLLEQQLGEIGAVLAGDAGDQRALARARSWRRRPVTRRVAHLAARIARRSCGVNRIQNRAEPAAVEPRAASWAPASRYFSRDRQCAANRSA